MKRFLTLLLIIGSLSFVSLHTYAGISIEPYLGYEKGKEVGTLSGAVNGSFEVDYSGYNLGLRLGYSMLLFSFGADYMLTTYEDDDDDSNSINQLGAFVAIDLPVLLRFYAVYMFSVKNTETDSSNVETDFEGTGYKVGIGYTGLPFVSINLEVIAREYDDISGTLLGIPITLSGSKAAGTMLSLSIPF